MGLRKKKSLLDQAKDTASGYVDQVRPHVESAVTTAKDRALPLIADAREKAGPAIADARAKAGPAIADAREKAAPIIAEGAAIAADKASVGAALAAEKAAIGRDIAAAKFAEIKGEPPKKKGGKLKKLVLFGGLAGVAAFVASKLKGGQQADNWQSSYVPSPPPPAPAAPRSSGDDTAGSGPGEAIADAAGEPHDATTPDDPAEVVTIDEDAAKKA